MAYLPTPSAETGFAAGLKMTNWPGGVPAGSPGRRPALPRSSSHMAQGQASRKYTKL